MDYQKGQERAKIHLINQTWTNKRHHNPTDLVQPSYPQETQLLLQPAGLPELSPQHYQPLDLHKHQLPMQTCCLGWAHHKYHCKMHKLQLPTFPQYLACCLQKTGSALAVSRRYVIRKLQLSTMKTHQQNQQHILYHQGLDQLQQWTIPPKEIRTNLDTRLSQN